MKKLALIAFFTVAASAAMAQAVTPTQSNLLGSNNLYQATTQTNANAVTQVNDGGTIVNQTFTPTEQTINQTVRTAPSMAAPALTSNGYDVCLGSASGSVSGLGFGVSGGKTVIDENCVRLKNVARLTQLGLTNAAIALQAEDVGSAAALKQSSPEVYVALQRDKLAQLEAEFEVAKEAGLPYWSLEEPLNKLRLEVKALEMRLAKKASAVVVTPIAPIAK